MTKESHVDPQTGHTQLEATATITKDMYEEYFGRQFSCYCVAWNSRGEAKSRAAFVEVASKLILFSQLSTKNIYSIFYLFNCNLMMLEWILWYIWKDFYATHVRAVNFLTALNWKFIKIFIQRNFFILYFSLIFLYPQG